MIVKMIKNLENKMELQVNRLEARIEMKEMFNKDLEEKKKRSTSTHQNTDTSSHNQETLKSH